MTLGALKLKLVHHTISILHYSVLGVFVQYLNRNSQLEHSNSLNRLLAAIANTFKALKFSVALFWLLESLTE